MKTKIYILTIIFGFFSSSTLYSQEKEKNSSDKEIIEMLNTFYREYITENDNMPVNEKKINLIKKKYCTNNLIEKIKKDDLDYDPLVNAQDISREWIKTMKITKDSKKENAYIVCFTDKYNKTPFCTKLLILKSKEGFKIDKAN